eukprot:299441-Chlamydomonas_euryale.AAC.1
MHADLESLRLELAAAKARASGAEKSSESSLAKLSRMHHVRAGVGAHAHATHAFFVTLCIIQTMLLGVEGCRHRILVEWLALLLTPRTCRVAGLLAAG